MISKFLTGVGFILLLYIISAYALAVFAELGEQAVHGLYYSGLLATLNVIAAYGVISIAIKREQKAFAKIFLGGMVIRILILLSVIFLILKFSAVNHFIFIGSLFILYFIYQIWEVTFLNKNFIKSQKE